MMTVRVDVDQLLQLLPILTRSVGALDRCDDELATTWRTVLRPRPLCKC